MKKDKDYVIYFNGRIMAYGSANEWQIKDWEKAGYVVLRTNKNWGAK